MTTATTGSPGKTLGSESFDEVVLEEVSTVGAYQLSLISAATGAGLSEWAVSRGLSIGPETAEVLDGYIAGGAWFVAAEVSVAAREREVSWLPPLQIAYTSPVISLPIRLGATSSAGMQEMLIFILNHGYEGWTGISNYEEAPIQSECLVSQRDFGAFYEARAHQALEPRGVDVLDDTGDTASSGPFSDPCIEDVVEAIDK